MQHLLLWIFLLLSTASYSQDFFKNKADSIKGLSQKWKLIETVIDDKDTVSSSADERFLLIKKEGTYEMVMESESLKGKWDLDTRKNILTTNDEEGLKKWKIIKLSGTQLRLETVNNDREKILMILKI